MNEQLIVKNFGPIKDATVDFKRVTVFIGPTGGGKSTLAKLAAIFRVTKFYYTYGNDFKDFTNYSIRNFLVDESAISWLIGPNETLIKNSKIYFNGDFADNTNKDSIPESENDFLKEIIKLTNNNPELLHELHGAEASQEYQPKVIELLAKVFDNVFSKAVAPSKPLYVPSERTFLGAIEYSWAGLMRDNIGLSNTILNFANDFSLSRKNISELDIPFLNVRYVHRNGQDFIKIPESETLFRLYETASGIQSVTPLLVLLEHLSRNTEQAQSFIIEEPELNLYPTAQQGLLNWLVKKCTQGENDLTITTHSPYILSHLNLLLYAHHVGNKDEEKRRKVAAIIPEKYWVNPDEFAAYYVNGPEGAGGVRSLLDPETKLISQNELDAVSGIQADEFDQLLDINRGF